MKITWTLKLDSSNIRFIFYIFTILLKVYWKNLSDLTKRHLKIKKYAKLDEVATNKAIFYFIRIKDGWAHWKMPQKSISCVIKSLYGQNSSLN